MNTFSTVWELYSSVFIFLLGAYLSKDIASKFKISKRRSIIIYIWHTFFCVLYVAISLKTPSDSIEYYIRGFDGNWKFSPGVESIMFITTFFVQIFGFSYLGVSLIFNFIGYVGLVCFDASLTAIIRKKPLRPYLNYIVFLPSISFWSCAIGKDTLSFLSVSLALYGSLNTIKNLKIVFISIFIMFLVRPHIALIMIISFVLSLIVNNKVSKSKKIFLVFFIISLLPILYTFVMDYVGLGTDFSARDLNNYTQSRIDANLGGGGAVNISDLSFPMKLFTYMYRPFIFEAHSFQSLMASIENLILLLATFFAIIKYFRAKRIEFNCNVNYLVAYFILTLIVLSLTTSNLGIAVRQKWMFTPIIIYFIVLILNKKNFTLKSYGNSP